jgi:hypothetical protein
MPISPAANSAELLLALAKSNYLDYRKVKAIRAGNKSAKMISKINALESQLAVRGQIPSTMGSQNIVSAARLSKTMNQSANESQASAAIAEFLGSGHAPVFLGSPATALQKELELLAHYITSKIPGAKYIPGPLKTLRKALGKTQEDYDFAWTMNKDLVRGTVVCKNDAELKTVRELMVQTCTERYGMYLMKNDWQKSDRDGGFMKSGYSGLNFVIQFKDHTAFGCELQGNTFDMMYGKMSKKDYCEKLQVSEAAYGVLQGKHKFPGGLGHSLYDIQDPRAGAEGDEADRARKLASDYNDACRGQYRKNTLQGLNKEIQEFGKTLKTQKPKDLWKHDVEGCGWGEYPIPLH